MKNKKSGTTKIKVFSKLKTVLSFCFKAIKALGKITLWTLNLLCCIAMLLIPFLHHYIPKNIAVIIWSSAVVAIFILDIVRFILNKKNKIAKKYKYDWEEPLDQLGRGASISIFSVLASALIINYFDTGYTWKWAIGIFFFLFSMIGLRNIYGFQKSNANCTEKQLSNLKRSICKLVIFYFLAGAFYVSILLNRLVLQYIFGVPALLMMLYSITNAFLSHTLKTKWLIIHDFVAAIILTIYLIYAVPIEPLRNIILAIVSAVYGGFIALVGVAWTIRDGHRREAETKRLEKMPYLRAWLSKDTRSTDCSIPGLIITTYPYNNVEDNTGNIYTLNIENIGLGLAHELHIEWVCGDYRRKHELQTTLIRNGDAITTEVLFDSAKSHDAGSCKNASIIFSFSDLLANRYTQELRIAFYPEQQPLQIETLKMDSPVFIEPDSK